MYLLHAEATGARKTRTTPQDKDALRCETLGKKDLNTNPRRKELKEKTG